MAKQKTKRAAAKRFTFTGTGKIKRRAAYHRHQMTHKAQSTKVQDRKGAILARGDAKLVRMMLPHGG
jgi:large subunit ribosomal protein L35